MSVQQKIPKDRARNFRIRHPRLLLPPSFAGHTYGTNSQHSLAVGLPLYAIGRPETTGDGSTPNCYLDNSPRKTLRQLESLRNLAIRLRITSAMTLHRAPSRSWTLAPTVILIAGFAYGLRATVLGGFIAPLNTNRFEGDFSAMLFNGDWWCRDGERMDVAYGPLFTFLNHAVATFDGNCNDGSRETIYHISRETLLFIVLGVNIGLVVGALYLISRLFSFSLQDSLILTTLWLIDHHLRYSLAVSAVLEYAELVLILGALLLLRRNERYLHIYSGVLLGIAVMIKLAPLIFLPLLLFRTRYVALRLFAFIGTVLFLMGSLAIYLGISLTNAIMQLIPRGATGREYALDENFRSFSSGLVRVLTLESGTSMFNIVYTSSAILVLLMLLGAVIYTGYAYRIDLNTGEFNNHRFLLQVGLYFSLLPLVNIAHGHTFLFLVAVYSSTYWALKETVSGNLRRPFLIVSVLLYLWISQSLIVSFVHFFGLSFLPNWYHENGIANFGLVILCVALAWNYEKDGQALCSEIQTS